MPNDSCVTVIKYCHLYRPLLREGLHIHNSVFGVTKIDDDNDGLSYARCLCNLVRPDLAAQDGALLRLLMDPFSSDVIIGLPASLSDETTIPGTLLPSLSLFPILLYIDGGDGSQGAHALVSRP